jgi:hypothetical protein
MLVDLPDQNRRTSRSQVSHIDVEGTINILDIGYVDKKKVR